MLIKSHYASVVLLFACLGISACGSGSSEDTPAPNPPVKALLVNAGSNVSVNENESVILIGGSSGGDGVISYQWQADDSIQITHSDTSLTDAVLLTPTVTQITDYSISLIATDTRGTQSSDTIIITVNPVNEAPIARIQANQISGYASKQFPVSAQIILDGSSSSDIDPQTNDAPITAYQWQQIAGPSLLAGVNTSQSSITLVSPIINESQQATFRLSVTDQEQASTSTDYTVTLLSQDQTNGQVDLKSIRSVFSGELVVLSANASSLAPAALPFTGMWSNDSTALISDASAFNTVSTSPLVTENQTLTYTFTATDSFRNSVSAQIEAQVFAPVTRVINDTGANSFANANSMSSHHQSDYPGQDASYGADRQTASGQVIKVGSGEQGFDFTRLDNNGDAVENPSFSFSCVRDNVTALVWQVKGGDDASSINYTEQNFTWFSENDNGNFAGELNALSDSCNVESQNCNTQAYIDQINTQGQCGFFDWRLPSPNELQSIIHYGKSNPPMVDSVFFPYLGSNVEQIIWYWTSQTSADGVNSDIANNAWAYDLQSGNDGFLIKSSEQRVILVRAGR